MEQKEYSIEQFLNAKINQKAQAKIGELSSLLFEAEAKADLLQELYNQSQKELEELKAEQVTTEEAEVEVIEPKPNRAQRRQKDRA